MPVDQNAQIKSTTYQNFVSNDFANRGAQLVDISLTRDEKYQSETSLNKISSSAQDQTDFNSIPIKIRAPSMEFTPDPKILTNSFRFPARRKVTEIKSAVNQPTPVQIIQQQQQNIQSNFIESTPLTEIQTKESDSQNENQIPIQVQSSQFHAQQLQKQQNQMIYQKPPLQPGQRQEYNNNNATFDLNEYERRLSMADEDRFNRYQKILERPRRRSSKINDENNIGELNDIFNKMYSRHRLSSLSSLNEVPVVNENNKRYSLLSLPRMGGLINE